MEKIVVVGGSPKLLEVKNGSRIDLFPNVCRLNDYCTDGFEEFVGTKVTHWLSGASKQTQVKRRSIKGIQVIAAFPLLVFKKAPLKLQRYFRFIFKTHVSPFPFNEITLKEQHEICRLTGIEYPSTGLMAITYFRFLKNMDVTITGFDFFTSKKQHYYNDKELEHHPSHTFYHEKNLVEKWIQNGEIQNL